MPSSLTSVGQYCFYSTAIKEIDLYNIKSIPGELFAYCKNLQTFEIPETVELIELAVLNYSVNPAAYPTSVKIPTFWGVPLKKLVVRGNNSTNALKAGLFDRNYLYTQIASGWYGTSQEELDYSWCESLEYLELGRPVSGKLLNCPDLTTLVVNYECQSMTDIIQQEMYQLTKLKTLQISSLTPPTNGAFSHEQYMDLQVVVPDNALESYRSANVWKNFWNLISKSDFEAGIDKCFSDVQTEIARYDLYGNIVTPDYQGVVIAKYSDGSAVKIIQR